MRPSTAGTLAKIVTPTNAQQAIVTTPGTYGFVLRGIEVGTGPSVTLTYTLIQLGDGSTTAQTMLSQVPQHFILSQMYIHGSATGEMQRCVGLNAGWVAIVDSWISDCHGKGYDSQAVGGWNGTGPYLIDDNYLEGAGENVMFGGAAPGSPDLEAADVTIRHNHIKTPVAWKGVWTKKNLMEIKTAHRVLVEGNVFDGSWTDAQTGFGIMFKSSVDAPYPGMNTTDVTFRDNVLKNVGAAFQVTGRENVSQPDWVALYPNDNTARIQIFNNTIDSVNVGAFTGAARLLLIGGVQHAVADLAVQHNTFTTTGSIQHFVTLDATTPPAVDRLSYDNNITVEGDYGIFSPAGFGKTALDAYTSAYTFSNNVIVKGSGTWTYPATTTMVTSITDALNISGAGADGAAVSSQTSGVVIAP